MKIVNDGTKSIFGDANPLGWCSCYCTTGSGYDATFAGSSGSCCACGCSTGRHEDYQVGHVVEP
jgi:hypothetical protein